MAEPATKTLAPEAAGSITTLKGAAFILRGGQRILSGVRDGAQAACPILADGKGQPESGGGRLREHGRHAPQLVPESRPYRLGAIVESDAHHVVALLRRGAHRAALAGYRGPVLPGSTAPGVTEIRDRVATVLNRLPRDARIVLEAALAASDPAGAKEATAWLKSSGFEGTILRGLAQELQASTAATGGAK